MKTSLQNVLNSLREANGPTRFVLGLAMLMILGVAGVSWYRSANPQMEFFRGDLESAEFSRVTSALGAKGIRFETSSGRAPYTVWVESGRRHEAWNAVAIEGALTPDARGIDTAGGASAFDAAVERNQRADARHWQEVEKQLEVLSWVARASVKASIPRTPVLGRTQLPTVSVVVATRGLSRPSITQARAATRIVANAFCVPDDRVLITDQEGTPLTPSEDEHGLAGILEFQASYDDRETQRAQDWLDRTYGPGVAVVSVKGEWTYERIESVDETLDPKSKAVMSDRLDESTDPMPLPVGGPAGVQANVTAAKAQVADAREATRSDSEKTYAYGSKTTHRVMSEPRLERISVSLLLDESHQDELAAAEATVKGLVGFDATRNDSFSAAVRPMFGLERDEAGMPVAPAAVPMPEAPSATTGMLVEWGLELLAGAAFVFVLLRSLKKGATPAAAAQPAGDPQLTEAILALQNATEGDSSAEELARRHVEELLEADPDRVGALLSRWALGEDYYQQKVKA